MLEVRGYPKVLEDARGYLRILPGSLSPGKMQARSRKGGEILSDLRIHFQIERKRHWYDKPSAGLSAVWPVTAPLRTLWHYTQEGWRTMLTIRQWAEQPLNEPYMVS